MLNAAVPVDQPLQLFILLILGHFLADFPLQGDRMAVEKCPGKDVVLNWRWWLSAHAATHGFVVALLTGLPVLGLVEMLSTRPTIPSISTQSPTENCRST